jgi:hypothetical protein
LVYSSRHLTGASFKNAGAGDLREAARLILEGNWLVFAVKVMGDGDEFPRLRTETAA